MRYRLWLITILISSISFLSAQIEYVNNETSNFLKLSFVGDVSLNKQVLDASYIDSRNSYDFQYIFHYIRPVLNLSDIVVGNIENTFGPDKDFLKSGLNNAPDEYGVALKYAGFNVLMNANGTAVYQELDEWKLNKEYYDELRIAQVGSFEHEEDRYKRNPTILDKYGIKVAFLNYMDGLSYYPEVSPLVNGVQEDVIKRDIILAKNRGADFIVVYMNWGQEYQSNANVTQQNLADLCIKAGANAVIGSHPHVVQDVLLKDDLINGKFTNKVIAYSLGDFVSTTSSPIDNGACILEIILEKNKKDGITVIKDVGYLPTYTAIYESNDKAKYAIMPVSQVEKGNITVPLDNTEKQWMSGASENTRHKFSGKIDEVEYELDDEIVDDVAEVLTVKRRPLNEDKEFKLGINNHLLLALNGFDGEEGSASKPIIYEGVVYKIQFLSLRREMPIDTEYYKHLKGYEIYNEGEYFHYVIGNYRNLKRANDFCLDVKRNGHKYAYVVAFENGEIVK